MESRLCPEGKTYCTLGMVSAAISTDFGDGTLVEDLCYRTYSLTKNFVKK